MLEWQTLSKINWTFMIFFKLSIQNLMIENIKRKHTSRSVDVIGHNEKLTNSKEWKKNVFTNLISSCGSTSLSVTMRTLGSSLASSTSSSVSIISKPCRHAHKNENWKQNLESDLAEENKINSYIDMMCFLNQYCRFAEFEVFLCWTKIQEHAAVRNGQSIGATEARDRTTTTTAVQLSQDCI